MEEVDRRCRCERTLHPSSFILHPLTILGVDVFWGILQRTIFMELVRVFSLALIGLTGILLMGGIFAEATQHGLTPGQVLSVIPLLIPNTLPYTLPTTTLFATCVVYGRLSPDNEILAIKAAGINGASGVWR